MALNGKYINVEHIIETIYRNYGFRVVNLDETKEWLWDIMSLIAVPDSFVDRLTDGSHGNEPITISSYRAKLPDDLYELVSVREYYDKIPLVEITDIFYLNPNVSESSGIVDYDATTVYYDTNGEQDDDEATSFISLLTENSGIEQYTYKLNNNYIYVGFEEGTIEIAYKAFPIDSRGFPLIPDDVKFIRAASLYIAQKIAFKMYLKDDLSHQKLEKIEQEYVFAVGAAKTKGNIPSLGRMEAIKRRYLSLVPRVNEFGSGFKYSSDNESLK